MRSVRVDGPVVTLGEAERRIHSAQGEEEAPGALNLGNMVEARVEAVRRQLNEQWEARLNQERERQAAGAARQLEEAETRWQAELERVKQERYDEGHQAGLAAREAEAREAVERFGVVHDSLARERGQVLREAEVTVVDLAVALARRVVGIQAEMDHKVLVRIVRSALEHLSDHSFLQIKVHPDDLQIARRFAAAWVEKVSQSSVLRVEASDHVSRGGCMIEGQEENVDARLVEQFQVLQDALRGAIYGDEAEGDE